MNRLQRLLFIGILSTTPFVLWGKGSVGVSEVRRQVAQQDAYIRDIRRHFHQHPELSGQEVETVKFLKAELQKLGGFDIHDVPGSTGFYAILDTGR